MKIFRGIWSAYAYARATFKSSIAYPGDVVGIFIQSLSLFLLFLLAKGHEVSSSHSTLSNYIAYFFLCNIFFIFCSVSPEGQFAGAVRTGVFTLYDTMPSHIFWRSIGTFCGRRILPTILAILVALVVYSINADVFLGISYQRLLFIIILLPMSGLIVCLFDMLVSYLAFYSPLHRGIGEFKTALYVLTSGIVFPLDSLPDSLQKIAYFTPFPFAVYEPALLLSQSNSGDFASVAYIVKGYFQWGLGLAILVGLIEVLRLRSGRTFEV